MTDLFPETVPDTRLSKGIAEVQREIAMRKSFYPRQIEAGRMTQSVADQRVAALENLLEYIREKM